jgi:hypothetical protein
MEALSLILREWRHTATAGCAGLFSKGVHGVSPSSQWNNYLLPAATVKLPFRLRPDLCQSFEQAMQQFHTGQQRRHKKMLV